MMIGISLSEAFHNKTVTGDKSKAYDYSFTAVEVSSANLIRHILAGNAWAVGTYRNNRRKREIMSEDGKTKNPNFIQSSVLALDLDDKGVSVADCLQLPEIASYAVLVHPSATSTTEKPKTRVVFVLDKPIKTIRQWELAQQACMSHFRELHPDVKCKDAARFYFGSDRGKAHERPDNILPMSVVAKWVTAYQEHEQHEKKQPQMDTSTSEFTGEAITWDAVNSGYAYKNVRQFFRNAEIGNRNARLNKAAYLMFGFVKSGIIGITNARIEIDLMVECEAIGFDDSFTKQNALSTLKSVKHSAPPIPLNPKYADTKIENLEQGILEQGGTTYQQATMNSLQATLARALVMAKSENVGTDDIKSMVEKVQAASDKLLAMTGRIEVVTGMDATRKAHQMIQAAWDNPQWVQGLRTGLTILDYAIGGVLEGQCTDIIGATGTGKTTMTATLACAFSKQAPGIIVSCEQVEAIFIMRMVACLSGIPFGHIRRGGKLILNSKNVFEDFEPFSDFEKDKIKSAEGQVLRLMESGTVILPGSSPSPAMLKSFVRRNSHCKWMILDSLGDVHLPYVVSEYEDVSFAAKTAEDIAVDHNIAVINTVQIGRNTKGRAVKEPDLYDARGSGKVEEKASVVIGLYNHWYHVAQKQVKEKASDEKDYPKGTVQYRVLKLRDGAMGTFGNLRYKGGCGYYNMAATLEDA